MKQSLQLKMGQQLTMTPQLQQAIRLLQLSTLDLQQEIQQNLDSNPMLEEIEEGEEDEYEADANGNDDTVSADAGNGDDSPEPVAEDTWSDEIGADLPVDTEWEDVYPATEISPGSGSASSEDRDFLFDQHQADSETLHEHLEWQLNLAGLSDTDRAIGTALIDGIDEDGMLSVSIEDIVESFGDEDIGAEEVIAVLRMIQSFDPPGVGARDLQECLILQLGRLPEHTPHLDTAIQVVRDHLAALGNRDYTQIMQRMKIREPELREIMETIRSLSPRPGSQVSSTHADYVIPDVIVRKRNGRWQVELNPETAPRLRINSHYEGMVRRADTSADNVYMRNQLQEARWFLKSLQSRNETLIKVASRIVEHQRGFLEYGEEAMKPLVLHDIAEAVEMHESTISRVTTQKYMHTPRGIYELKYFFSSHVGTTGGGECSSTAIRAIIRKIVKAENPGKPLSDSKIADLLAEQGIKVARRTIAKYRESLSIPPSNERKQLV